MKTLFASTAAILFISAPSWAVEIPADSVINRAAIYPAGATIYRQVKFESPAGDHNIVIGDLPMDLDTASLRVKGSGDTEFSILSVNHRFSRLPPVPPGESPEYQRIEQELEALEDDMTELTFKGKALRSQVEVADGRLRFVELLMNRKPQEMVDDVEHNKTDPVVWSQGIEVLATQMQEALTARNAAELDTVRLNKQAEKLREKINDKQQELNAVQQPLPPRSIAEVEIAAGAELSGTLEISYRISSAGWEPVYDLRLDQGDKTTLQIDRHARVYQHTGEAWNDVELTLSTSRPSGRMDAPSLYAQQAVTFPPIMAEQRYEKRQGSALMDSMASPAASKLEDFEEDVIIMEDAPSGDYAGTPSFAGMETNGQTVVYKLATPADIAGDGTVRQLAIDSNSTEVELSARANPIFDKNAYMYANFVNALGSPLLPGRASAFRDGTFLGQVNIPFTAAGADAKLPFGVVDGLEITRQVLGKQDGDFGIIGTTNRRVEQFEITAKSLLPYDIDLTIFDRAPFSEEEDLTVQTTATPRPTETDFEGQRGVQAWTFDLKSGATKAIKFGFELQWPGDRNINVE